MTLHPATRSGRTGTPHVRAMHGTAFADPAIAFVDRDEKKGDPARGPMARLQFGMAVRDITRKTPLRTRSARWIPN